MIDNADIAKIAVASRMANRIELVSHDAKKLHQ